MIELNLSTYLINILYFLGSLFMLLLFLMVISTLKTCKSSMDIPNVLLGYLFLGLTGTIGIGCLLRCFEILVIK